MSASIAAAPSLVSQSQSGARSNSGRWVSTTIGASLSSFPRSARSHWICSSPSLPVAGVVFSSGLRGVSFAAGKSRVENFMFLQMSDLHWGFTGPAVNPDAEGTLDKAIAHVNALPHQPDFIVFTGDLTHTTDDPEDRRKRLAHVRDAVGKLKVKKQRYLAGEHDAALDRAEAFKEFFGETHYTFDHKGVHFIVLDNVSDPTGKLGDEQIQWLRADLGKLDKEAP